MRSLGSCKWGGKGRSRKDLLAHLFSFFPQGRAHGLLRESDSELVSNLGKITFCTLHSIGNEAFCYCMMAP